MSFAKRYIITASRSSAKGLRGSSLLHANPITLFFHPRMMSSSSESAKDAINMLSDSPISSAPIDIGTGSMSIDMANALTTGSGISDTAASLIMRPEFNSSASHM
eukprot:gene39167-51561_t